MTPFTMYALLGLVFIALGSLWLAFWLATPRYPKPRRKYRDEHEDASIG